MTNIRFHIMLFIIIISLPFCVLHAFQDSTNTSLSLDDILETNASELEDENLYDLYEDFIDNPININSADKNVLLDIPFVDEEIADKIIAYRIKNNKFYSVKELYLIDGLETYDVKKIIPFVRIDSNPENNSQQSVFKKLNFVNRTRIYEKYDPEENNNFAGNDLKFYQRLLINKHNYGNAGLLFEKDPGETRLNDFSSFYLEIFPGNIFNRIIVGDYYVEFGQGLVLWRPYAFSKGSDVITPFNKKAKNIVPNKSSNESGFFRGASLQLKYSSFTLNLFYSDNFRDATLDENGKIQTIVTAGYHRTSSELAKKNNVSEKTFGGILSYANTFFSVDMLAYRITYSHDLAYKNSSNLYGNGFNFYSLNYNLSVNKINLSGECAYNEISVALINKIYFNLNAKVKLLISLRNYPRNFANIFGNAIGENSGSKNETGFYTGVKYNLPIGSISFYYDVFRFPNGSNESGFSSNGNEIMFFFDSKMFGKLNFKLKYKYKTKEITKLEYESPFSQTQNNYRVQLYYQPLVSLQFQTGLNFVHGKYEVDKEFEQGYLLFQNLKYHLKNFIVNARICFYETGSYNSRIYMYENDLTGVMTNLPFYDEGYKWYLLFSYKPTSWLNLSLKYSRQFFDEEFFNTNGVKEFGKYVSRISFQIDNSFE